MATTPNRNYTVVDTSPEKAYDPLTQLRDFQYEVDADVESVATAGGPLTTKGDLFGYSTLGARIPIGTNGQVLTADSAESLGLKWANPAGGGDALTASPLSQFAATTSAQLRSVLSDENGTGAALFDNATSVNLITPTLGVASATSINKLTITAPATSATLTIADGKTLTVNNTLTLTATDGSTLAIGGGGTLGSAAYTAASLYGLVANPLSQFAATTSAQLRGVLSDELGTGAALFDGATPTSFVLTNATGLPISTGLTGAGTGVLTALGVNVGSAGAVVVNGGALGTPSSATLTNATSLPVATGISGLGSGVATFLATPSSANLAAAVTGETGSGALVFATSPSLTTSALLSSGFVFNWDAGDVTLTHGSNALSFAGATVYNFDANISGTTSSFSTSVTSPVYKGQGIVSTTGDIRGQNGFSINARNQANDADVTLISSSNGVTAVGTGNTYVQTPALQIAQFASPVTYPILINAGRQTLTNETQDGLLIVVTDGTNGGTTSQLRGGYIEAQSSAPGCDITFLRGLEVWTGVNHLNSQGSTSRLQGIISHAYSSRPITTRIESVRAEISMANSATSPLGVLLRGIYEQADAGTSMTDLRGLSLDSWTFTAGAITTSYGIYMDSSIDRGATRYALYSLSTSPSLLSGALTVNGTLKLGPVATGVVPGFFAKDVAANYSIFGVYPQSGTNVNASFQLFPKGTGQANNRAQISVFNTDGVADTSNIEFLTLRSTGTSFLIASGQSGSGMTLRPIILSAGAASGTPINTSQLVLSIEGNVKIAGTATRATTEGTNHLDIFNGTAPVGTLANGISLYSTAGELRVMDAAGNATLLSPHDKDGLWIWECKNTVTGKVLRVEMERMMKAVNDLLGVDFVHEYMEAVN